MRHLLSGLALLTLTACSLKSGSPQPEAGTKQVITIAAQRATPVTFRQAARDSAVWTGPNQQDSVLFLTGGEGGLELHDLDGAMLARFETIEAGFVEARQQLAAAQLPDLVIAAISGQGALRAFAFDRAGRQLHDITARPIQVDDEITGLCSYWSVATHKLYAFIATDQGQLVQFELYADAGKVSGRFIRRIAAGKGVAHCVADDDSGQVFFSEESVGIWRVAAEPESDAARVAIDLVAPRGALDEEVKGLAIHRASDRPVLIAASAGNGTFNVYSLEGELAANFQVAGGGMDIGDAEGLTLVSGALGADFPQGALIIADEDAGNYKLVDWKNIASAVLPAATTSSSTGSPRDKVFNVEPSVETEPAASFGDAADDPAIWVDRRDARRSVVIGTDKKLGLNVYDMSGKLLQTVADGRMNNVDLRDGFMLDGKPVVVVAATNRTTRSISLYTFDPVSRRLTSVSDGVLDAGLADPYGLCLYRSVRTGDLYVFANDSVDGRLRQWKLLARSGRIAIDPVRDIEVGSQAEGCVADDELGLLYVAEEDIGIWKYAAEPDGGTARDAVDSVGTGHLQADVEGLAIYAPAGGNGYLIASNQGEDNYALYRREGNNAFVGKFRVVANESRGIDGSSETDGLDVVSQPLGQDFPSGMLVVQDGRNLMPVARQNFKYVSWQDVMHEIEAGVAR